MHSLRERPRVAVFRLLSAGVLIGVLVDRDDPKGSSATQTRLVRAEHGLRDRAALLTRTRAQLRRDLRRAERALRRATKAADAGTRSR
jgi:hypothetical protein